MTILLMPNGTDGGAPPPNTGNDARISLVIDAPDQKNFAGITSASAALTALETQLKRVNETMQTLGLKKFPDIGKTVTDQTKGMADAAAGIAKLTSSLEELGKVKTKITKGGELLGGTVETKPFSTGTFKINDKGQAEEIKTIESVEKARKAAVADAIRDSKSQLVEEINAAKAKKAAALSVLKHAAGPHADNVSRAKVEQDFQKESLKSFEQYHARAKAMGDITGQQAGSTAYANAQVKLAKATGQVNIETARLNESYSHIGKNMLQNIAHVTAWSASVGVLYGSLRVLKESVGALVELQYQQARLSVVMNLSQSDTAGLTDDILKLAAANGRSGDDAMKAATQWARLGMSKRQVAEATRVSLVAANVAEVTAAEATESLSAIMVTYGLHAGQLNGVLGMLNQTSNTYNVTVAELLNGLERVSSVAKQAGLSLAETQGIIGAAAGATGQTGANIGNSLKSFIGAVSGEEGQKNLRSFGIETTAGGEVKDMTRIVNELYVAYQRMSEAERRTMIFSTVGKNQASRVTAMLDNYVKSQVLAVNSLNNLNSAGKENEVILATMKSQLQGVITEWQRFVALQAKNISVVSTGFNGPMSDAKENKPWLKHGGPLGQSMSAISNIGKLANTGFGSAAATAAIGLMTVGLMRLALNHHHAAMAASGTAVKNNILVSTSKAVTAAMHGLKTALYDAAGGFTATGNAALAASGKMNRFQQSKVLFAGAMGSVFNLSNLKLGVWMAGLVVLGELINRTADWAKQKTGNNSDEVISDAESMGQAAETISRSAEGYSIAARLFQTSKDAMTEALKKPGQSDATMSQILSQIAGLNTSLPGVEARMKEASKSVTEFMSALETEKINALSQQYIKQAQAISEINKQVAKLQAQTDRLNATKPLGMDNDTWLKKRAELEGKLAEAKNSKVKVVSSAAYQMKQDIADQFNTSVVGLRFLDQQKMVLSEISHIYKEIGANSDYSTQQDLEVHRLRVVADLNANILKSLEDKKKAIEDAHKTVKPEEEQKRQEAIMGPLTTKREELQKALAEAQNVSMIGAPDAAAGQQIARQQQAVAAAKAALLANQKEIDEASKRLAMESSQTEEKTNYKKVLHAIGPATDAKLKSEAEAQASEAEAKRRINADSARFRYTAMTGIERARIESSGIGDDDFEKWNAKRQYLAQQREAFAGKKNTTNDEKLQQLEREKVDMGLLKDAAVQREVLEGKIGQHIKDRTKEYRKQLAMMGPVEMLRDLAVSKLAPGMTGGQFLSLAPDARKAVEGVTGRDSTVRELEAARDGFASLNLNAGKVGAEMDAVAGRIRLLLTGADGVVKSFLASLPADLVNALTKVDAMTVNAANVVVNQGAANPEFIRPVAGARASGGPVQRNRTYLTGEDGPEMFVPKQDGTIIPNKRTPNHLWDESVMDAIKESTSYNKNATNWLVNADSGSSKFYNGQLGTLTNLPGLLTIHGHGSSEKQGITPSSWLFREPNPLDKATYRDKSSPDAKFQGFSIEEVARSLGSQTNAVKKVFLTACYRAGYSVSDIKRHFPNADQIIAATTGLKPASAKEVDISLGKKKPSWLGFARAVLSGYADAEPYSVFSNSSTNRIDRLQDWNTQDEIDFANKLRYGSVEPRASGGPVLKDKTYLVGEKGPELVTMHGNGTVIPNANMQSVGIPKGSDAATAIAGGADNPYSGEQKNKWMKYFYDVAKQKALKYMPALSTAGQMTVGAGALISGGAYKAADSIRSNTNEYTALRHRLDAGNAGREYGIEAFGVSNPKVGPEVPNSIAAWAASEQAPLRSQDPYGPSHDNEESHTRFPIGKATVWRYSKPYAPYATVAQPGRQTGRAQQATTAPAKPATPRIPVAGGNVPVGNSAPAQGQGGAFPAVMAAASAAVATFSGAISAAASNVDLFSKALTTAIANMAPKTAFSGAPANADNPFS